MTTTLNEQMQAVMSAQFMLADRVADLRQGYGVNMTEQQARTLAHFSGQVKALNEAYETLRCLLVATEADAALRARMVVAPAEQPGDHLREG